MNSTPQIVFMVEGDSEKEFLKGLLPRLNIPDHVSLCRTFGGYGGLVKAMPAFMKSWRNENVRFMILCDQDSADCHERKTEILNVVPNYWKTRTVVRIACRELEAWYLGDKSGLSDVLPDFDRVRAKRKFRKDPDAVLMPARSLGEEVSFKKIDLAGQMGERVEIDGNQSPSMQVFIRSVRALATDLRIL